MNLSDDGQSVSVGQWSVRVIRSNTALLSHQWPCLQGTNDSPEAARHQ